jgi:hypothetical protein
VPFVEEYVSFFKDYESPTSFWKWTAYSCVAAVLRDSIYVKQGDLITYPNIFVLLLAQSAGRKGHPVNTAQRLIEAIGNTKVIAGRTSIQAIIDELGHVETSSKTGKLVKGGSAIFIASELAAGMVADDAAISILTDIYDFKANFKHHLRSTGRSKIDKIVFSMLAASNAELLKSIYTGAAIFGGLLGRTFLVTPSEYREPNSLFDQEAEMERFAKVVELLQAVTQLQGQIYVTEDAKKEYNEWYKPHYKSLIHKQDKSGILGRVHMNVVKLAMILMANDMELTLRKKHIEEAISECMSLLPNYQTFTMSSGKSSISEAGGLLFAALLDSPDYTISRKKFLERNWTNVDAELLDKCVVTLEQSGMIESILSGSNIDYRLTTKAKNALLEKGAQKNG